MDAVSSALQAGLHLDFTILTYKEHALEIGSKSQAVAYVGVQSPDGTAYWGAGIHTDIMTASVKALISAVNQMIGAGKAQ